METVGDAKQWDGGEGEVGAVLAFSTGRGYYANNATLEKKRRDAGDGYMAPSPSLRHRKCVTAASQSQQP